jgi:NAD(P)-dependent dehydrogenase (short-subunit alcohol dehydrogenase family)
LRIEAARARDTETIRENGGERVQKTTYEQKPKVPEAFPPQHQIVQPGSQQRMNPTPIAVNPDYKPAGKLKDKAIVVTGGDSGIGQAAAVAFAMEGADVAIAFLSERSDAGETKRLVEQQGRKCLVMDCNLKDESAAKAAIDKAVGTFGKLDVLVNNIAVQFPQNSIEDITEEQLRNTFETNVFAYFFATKAALTHMKPGGAIINTASVAAYEGSERLIDYSATKGAIVSFTRSLSLSLAKRGIRVNAVAPGPVWTPLIPSSFSEWEVSQFGKNTPLGRAAQPFELAPAYVYLASDDAAYVTGQVLHVNGGRITES